MMHNCGLNNCDVTLQGISAVCFDAFGTLIRYGGPRLNPYHRLLASGSSTQAQRLPFLTRNVGIEVLAQELGLADEVPSLQRELTEELAGLVLYPEVQAVFNALRQAGRKVAVCSNLAAAYGPAVRRLLPGLDAYALSYEVGAAKPDSAIYEVVCATLECRPGTVLFIGDSQRCDWHGPHAFGMAVHWLDRTGGQTLWDALVGKSHYRA